MFPLHLTFSEPAATPDAVELAMPAPVAIDAAARTISGTILPYNVRAERTSYGLPILFKAGALVVPDDLSRVKLLVDHDRAQSVGYAMTIEQDEAGARATFHVPAGPDGDAALQAAKDKKRDGLSVGVDIRNGYLSEDSTHYIVEEAVTNEVSLCAIPAFSDCRVTSVTASQTPPAPAAPAADTPPEKKETPHMKCEKCGHVHGADQACTPSGQFTHGPQFHGNGAGPAAVTLSQTFDAIATAIKGVAGASQVQAALTDILPAADAGHGLLTQQQVGELWQARGAVTPYLDFAVTRKELTSGFKVTGWAWNARPTVADYAGNKAAIPSSTASTKLIEATVARLAGGWDVDRIYVDLADGAMLRELVEMAIEDYADKANVKARTALIAGATTVATAGQNLAALLTTLGQRATTIGARIDYLAVAADVWGSFSGLNSQQVPWWLNTSEGINIGQSQGNLGQVKLWVDPDLAAGQWLAGDKRAATWWDKQPPVRVQAVDLPRGGVDVAVFGYYANTVSEGRAVWTGTTKTV